jgi:LPS-assembly protein
VRTPLWNATTGSLGVQYQDECTTLSVLYAQTFNDPATGLRVNNQTILVRLDLRTLGQATLSQNISGVAQDGVAQ